MSEVEMEESLQSILERHAFSQNVFFRRVALGISAEDFAARVGVSVRKLGEYETGWEIPRFPVVLKIAVALGCRVRDLFTDFPAR